MKKISISLPADTLNRVIRLARRERRSIGEVICEALQLYEPRLVGRDERLWAEDGIEGRRAI